MTVLVIGSDAIRVACGPGGPVDHRLAEAALQWIDDPIGLYEERPVAVAGLWRAVMATAVGGEPLVVVHPDDWTGRRVGRVAAAANAVVDDVRVLPRRQWSSNGLAEPDVIGKPPSQRRKSAPLAVAAGVVGLVAAAIAIWSPDGQTVTEGRIAVRLPADWTVTRVTQGPGSRRLQASAPADPDLAVHITQSYAPESTLAAAAEVLEGAIAEQSAGVFADFHADGRFAGRPAVTYREVRPGRVIDWSVLLVGSTLIGIGCQSPPQRVDAVQPVCRQAAASLGESGTDPRP